MACVADCLQRIFELFQLVVACRCVVCVCRVVGWPCRCRRSRRKQVSFVLLAHVLCAQLWRLVGERADIETQNNPRKMHKDKEDEMPKAYNVCIIYFGVNVPQLFHFFKDLPLLQPGAP